MTIFLVFLSKQQIPMKHQPLMTMRQASRSANSSGSKKKETSWNFILRKVASDLASVINLSQSIISLVHQSAPFFVLTLRHLRRAAGCTAAADPRGRRRDGASSDGGPGRSDRRSERCSCRLDTHCTAPVLNIYDTCIYIYMYMYICMHTIPSTLFACCILKLSSVAAECMYVWMYVCN